MQINTFSKLLILALATLMQTSAYADEHGRGEREHEGRGHENRGYENHSYENRGYENRGYENRAYGGRSDGNREVWHGDIRRFHERDMNTRRGGRWYHGDHDGRDAWWWFTGGMWYAYSMPVYPYPDPYQPPVVLVPSQAEPPVYVEQTPPQAQSAPQTQYWYYCTNPAGYYPYVPNCSVDWQKVVANPATPQ